MCYYALVQPDRLRELPSGPAGWHPLDDLPSLDAQQRPVVSMAHARLVSKLDYSTIAFQLMPSVFTLGALQRVYEVIRDEALDKRNIRKRILAHILETGANEVLIDEQLRRRAETSIRRMVELKVANSATIASPVAA
jgi:8-oxo-dGTP diphosphatase